MLEHEFHISRLLASSLKGQLTSSEQAELDQWLTGSLKRQILNTDLQSDELTKEALFNYFHSDQKIIWRKVKSGIAVAEKPNTIQVKRLWLRWVIAAVISSFIFSGLFIFYAKHTQKRDTSLSLIKYDIPPGELGATLTLADGRSLKLANASSGEIAEQDNVHIIKTPDGQLIYQIPNPGVSKEYPNSLNTLRTSKGENYVLTLPDKSKVWLNAASSLSYSADLLQKGKRVVELQGEAYFEVAKDIKHPFIVICKGQQVEVVGTHFNINAYQDEAALRTTLLEGSVKVSAKGLIYTLSPGQQLSNSAAGMTVVSADLDSVTDWKNGDFFLNHIEFKTAMRKIARWYDVEIIYDKSVPGNIQSGGWISKDKPLSSILRSIESSGLVKFKMEGRKVFVFQ